MPIGVSDAEINRAESKMFLAEAEEEYKCPTEDTLAKCKELFYNVFPEPTSQTGSEVFIKNCAFDLCMMLDGDDQVSIKLKNVSISKIFKYSGSRIV